MTADELKALIDHVEADAEAIATKLGKPAFVATLKSLKAMAESPLALELASLALTAAFSKLGLGDAKPAQAS